MLGEGQLVGQIRLVRLLGAGGMGEVWEGLDERLGRRVAVKSVRRSPGGADALARARFAREARILSRLEHPNVCRLYEYLRSEPDDVLVLELVRGRPLREAIAVGLDAGERLAIALGVCSALVAAHSLSIVHRDLKPDNVMLAEDGTVKVLDFGIARRDLARDDEEAADELPAAGPAIRDEAPGDSLTTVGDLIGTPGQMSPEQARGEPATAASDMFCFGLLLVELYTGRRPYEASTPEEVLAKAQWGDVPTPTGIDRSVAGLIGELVRLDPRQRPTAQQTWERLRRIERRPQRRLRAAAAAVAVVGLLAGTALSLAGLARARREAAVARATTDFLVRLFQGSDPQVAPDPEVKARELLARGSLRLRQELRDEPATRARLLAVLGGIQGNLGLHRDAQGLLEEALALEERRAGPDDPAVLSPLLALANAMAAQGEYAKAQELARRAAAIAARAGLPADEATALNLLSHALAQQGRVDEAEPTARQALATWDRAVGSDHPKSAAARVNLALLAIDRGRFEEAEGMLSPALAVLERHLGPDHPDVARAVVNLATTQKELGRFAAAELLYRRALAGLVARLGPDHPEGAIARNDLAVVLFEQRRFAEAEAEYRQAVALSEKTLGAAHPLTAILTANLAESYLMQGRADEAEPRFREALATLRQVFGEEHPTVAETLRGLGRACAALGRPGEAEELLVAAVRTREAASGPDHPELGKALTQLGVFYLDQGRPGDAAPLLARSRALLEPALPASHPSRLELDAALGRLATTPSATADRR